MSGKTSARVPSALQGPSGATEEEQGMAMGSTGAERLLKEWEVARDAIAKFDERLHDLRKYGFGFLIAFVTGQSVLFGRNQDGSPVIAEWSRVALVFFTLLIVLAIRLMEKHYDHIQKAAVWRARVLERHL